MGDNLGRDFISLSKAVGGKLRCQIFISDLTFHYFLPAFIINFIFVSAFLNWRLLSIDRNHSL